MVNINVSYHDIENIITDILKWWIINVYLENKNWNKSFFCEGKV